jgi:hypothetical protein
MEETIMNEPSIRHIAWPDTDKIMLHWENDQQRFTQSDGINARLPVLL